MSIGPSESGRTDRDAAGHGEKAGERWPGPPEPAKRRPMAVARAPPIPRLLASACTLTLFISNWPRRRREKDASATAALFAWLPLFKRNGVDQRHRPGARRNLSTSPKRPWAAAPPEPEFVPWATTEMGPLTPLRELGELGSPAAIASSAFAEAATPLDPLGLAAEVVGIGRHIDRPRNLDLTRG